jgi:hypothetical protein
MEYWVEYFDPLLHYSITPSLQVFRDVANS